jgi:magnesium transporter
MRGGAQARRDGTTAATTTGGTCLVAHLATDVPVVSSDVSAAEVHSALVGRRFATTAAVVVCDNGRLVGLVGLEVLFAAPRDAAAAELVDRDAVMVPATVDREVAVQRAVRVHPRRRGRTPRQRGVSRPAVPAPAPVAAARPGRGDALGRFGGLLQGPAGTQRDPCVLHPGVVYMADAVGTQTETLVVRGLSIGVGIRQVAVRELLTGLLVGITVAAAFVPVGLWRWGEGDVVLAVALSLLAACSIATLIAMALPWLLHRFGRDPAYGSGPLATVVQDLLSVVIYLVIAGILVH